MQKAATTSELQEAIEDHHLQTQKQVSRLEKVFKLIGEEPEAKKCEAIIGIVKEGESCIKDTEEGSMTRDAGLIIAASRTLQNHKLRRACRFSGNPRALRCFRAFTHHSGRRRRHRPKPYRYRRKLH